MPEGPNQNSSEFEGQTKEELLAELEAARAEIVILQGDNLLLHQQNEQLKLDAMEDPLTHAASRPYLLRRLKEHFSWLEHRANDKRNGRRLNGLSVMFFDFDHFKVINDRYGHGVGDRLLIEITKYLTELTRDEDTVCRWGGDEFVVCFPDINESDSALVAERLKKSLDRRLSSYLEEQKIGVQVTASIGIASHEPGVNVNELIERADQAMYQVKKAGKDGFFTYSAIRDQLG